MSDILDQISLAELQQRAAVLGISNAQNMERSALIAAIRQAAHPHGVGSSAAGPVARAPKKPEEPQGGIFIDYGLPIPDGYPGTRLRAMVQDADTIYVYWMFDHPPAGEFEVAAVDDHGTILVAFRSHDAQGSGYLRVNTARVARLSVSPVIDGQVRAPVLGASVAPSSVGRSDEERWIDVRTSRRVSNPPAPGRVAGSNWPAGVTGHLSSPDAVPSSHNTTPSSWNH